MTLLLSAPGLPGRRVASQWRPCGGRDQTRRPFRHSHIRAGVRADVRGARRGGAERPAHVRPDDARRVRGGFRSGGH